MSAGARDPYAIPGTDVLINKLGLTQFGVLRQAEYDLSRLRLKELQLQPIPGRFDLKHLQDVHRHVFQDVYEWAGQLRVVEINKGGPSFVLAERLRSVGSVVFGQLAADKHLRGLDKADFVDGLTRHYAAINALHPFREGNGRATQAFLSDLAQKAGHVIDYSKVDKTRWNEAARASFLGELGPMRGVFTSVVSPSRAVAFDRLEREQALRLHPELLPAYQRLDALGDGLSKVDPQKRAEAVTVARSTVSRALHAGVVIGRPAGRTHDPSRGIER